MQGDAGAVNGANEEQPRSPLQSVENLLVQAYEEEPAPGGQQRAQQPHHSLTPLSANIFVSALSVITCSVTLASIQ